MRHRIAFWVVLGYCWYASAFVGCAAKAVPTTAPDYEAPAIVVTFSRASLLDIGWICWQDGTLAPFRICRAMPDFLAWVQQGAILPPIPPPQPGPEIEVRR